MRSRTVRGLRLSLICGIVAAGLLVLALPLRAAEPSAPPRPAPAPSAPAPAPTPSAAPAPTPEVRPAAPPAAGAAPAAPAEAAPAAPPTAERIAEVTGTVVNVRNGPGVAYAAVTKVLRGTRVTVLGERGGWVKIAMPENDYSWVSAEFVQKGGENIGTLTGDGVNVRAEPATSGQVLGQLPLGYQVKIAEERTGWYRITPLPGTVGWVATDLLRIVSGAPLAASPAGLPAPAVTPGGAPGPTPGAPTGPTPAPETPAAGAPGPVSEAQKQFEEAEALFKAEVAKPDVTTWDVPKLITVYEALTKSPDRDVRFKADNRLSQLALYKAIQQRIAERQKTDVEVREKIQALDSIYQKQKKELDELRQATVKPGYLAVGVLRRLAIPYLPPATHKIQGEGRILFLLYSPDLDLSPYEGQKVGITGTLTVPSGWETPLIRVSAVHVLGE